MGGARTSLVRTSEISPVYLVHLVGLVCFVYLVDLVHLVSFVQPNTRDKPNKPNNGLLTLAAFFSILLEHEEEVKVIHIGAGGTGHDELMEPL